MKIFSKFITLIMASFFLGVLIGVLLCSIPQANALRISNSQNLDSDQRMLQNKPLQSNALQLENIEFIHNEFQTSGPISAQQSEKNNLNTEVSTNEGKTEPENTKSPEQESIDENINGPIPKIYYSGPKNKKQVALTFDDGPDAYFTPKILDILQKNHVKATFFVIGMNAKQYPEVLKRIETEGHAIGNHTWSHKQLTKLKSQQIKDQIVDTQNVFDSILSTRMRLFRPPYGSSNEQVLETASSLGYRTVNWSVDTRDWAGTSVSDMKKYVQDQLYSGGIILLHSSGRKESIANTVKALPEIIAMLKKQEYEFVTVPKLLGLSKAPATKANE